MPASLWLIWTGPSSHESQTQALFSGLLFPPWSKVECGASAFFCQIHVLQHRGATRRLEIAEQGSKKKRRMGTTKTKAVCRSLRLLTPVPKAAADLPFMCLVRSCRSWDPQTQRTPLAVILPRVCGVQPLASACVPWTRSEGEHKIYPKATLPRGTRFLQ